MEQIGQLLASLSLGRQYNILSGTTNDAITYGGRNPSTNTWGP